MASEYIALLMFGCVILSLLIGVPVAFSLAGIATIFGFALFGTSVFDQFLIGTWGIMKMYSLLAVPLFVFMGTMLANSGIAEKLYDSFSVLLGQFKGGLAVATVIICIFFGACTGVIGAAVITMALIALPGMLSRKYDHGLASGTITAGGCLGMVIPPSIMLILYGSEAGTSIATLFTAAIIPGVVLGLAYAVYIAVRCYINPSMGPTPNIPEKGTYSKKKIFAMMGISICPMMGLIFLVLGSIMFGVAAPSEAAALGALGSLVLCAFYKKLNFRVLMDSVLVTLKITSMVVFIALGAKYFISVFFRLGGHRFVGDLVNSMDVSPGMLMFLLFVVLFILGMFMDWIGLMMVFIPIFNPIISNLGYDPIWYGILFCLVMCLSLLSPPFAYAIFYLKGVAPKEMTLGSMYRGVVPFLIIHILLVVMVVVLPQSVLWLPSITQGR